MGAFLDKPKTDKHNESGQGNGLRYGLASMQGWRVEMEDAHCAITRLPGHLSGWAFFAVFDGHAGARVSERCANQLLNTIVGTSEFRKIDPEMVPSLDEIKKGIREGFLTLDEQMRKMPEVESGEDKSGSTAVCVLISPEHLYFANCGDSRSMLVRKAEVAFSTVDHKPVNPSEKERIQNAGGSVMIQRVNGSLAVSRSLGDYDYKKVEGRGPTEQLVSPEPEIDIKNRNKAEDEFIVLACDGIWDVMSNEELNAFIQHRLRVTDDLTRVCNEVIDTCLYKGSRDNMSIVIIVLENAPKVDPEAVAKDKALDNEIIAQADEYLNKCGQKEAELSGLISHITLLEISNLPPGGIVTKRHLIDARFHEFMNDKNNDQVGEVNNNSTSTNSANGTK